MSAKVLSLAQYRHAKQNTCARCGTESPYLQESLIKGLFTCPTGCPELSLPDPVRVLFRAYESSDFNPPAKSVRKAYEALRDVLGDNIYQLVQQ